MKIIDDFIRGNQRIQIISNGQRPTELPRSWQPVLNNCDILVAIPDMHMFVRSSTLDNFKFGADAMLSFLNHLDALKEELALQGRTLRIYQLGDLYEQRFPFQRPRGPNITSAQIIMSDPDYSLIVNKLNSMRTHFLYGNHDFELRHFPGFRFAAVEGKIHLEHGFAADTWKNFSDPDEPLWEPAQFLLKGLREIEAFFGNLLLDTKQIEKDAHFATGVTSGKNERSEYPSEQDYKKKKQEAYYSDRLINQANGANVRMTIIGHTHHPYMNTNVGGGDYFFVDAGAWIDGRANFVVVTNEELAICHYKR